MQPAALPHHDDVHQPWYIIAYGAREPCTPKFFACPFAPTGLYCTALYHSLNLLFNVEFTIFVSCPLQPELRLPPGWEECPAHGNPIEIDKAAHHYFRVVASKVSIA